MKHFLIALALLVAVAACGKDEATPTAPSAPTTTAVTIASSSSNVFIGSTLQMTASATFSNGTTQTPTCNWNSDNASVATINQNGVVTGQGSGEATVWCDASGKQGTKRLRGLPNYGGSWSGGYVVTGCTQSGGVGQANICGSATGTLPYTFTLTQGTDGVTGRFLLGTIAFENVSGLVAGGGQLALVGRSLSNTVQIDATWQLTSTQAGRLNGTIAQVWQSTTLTGQANINGTITTSTKTGSAPLSGRVPVSLQDAVQGILGR